MTTYTPRGTPAFLPQLGPLARRRTPSRTSVGWRHPSRQRAVASLPTLRVELWDTERAELRAALEQSWH